jgi:hypothetical protein
MAPVAMADLAHPPRLNEPGLALSTGPAGKSLQIDWAVDKRDLRGKLWVAEDVHQLSLAHMHSEYATVTTAHEILKVLNE